MQGEAILDPEADEAVERALEQVEQALVEVPALEVAAGGFEVGPNGLRAAPANVVPGQAVGEAPARGLPHRAALDRLGEQGMVLGTQGRSERGVHDLEHEVVIEAELRAHGPHQAVAPVELGEVLQHADRLGLEHVRDQGGIELVALDGRDVQEVVLLARQ